MSAASDRIDAAAHEIRSGRVQLFLNSGVEWLPDADAHLARLLSMIANAVWHEDTNHVPTLASSIRDQAEALAAAISREGRST